MWWNEPVFLAPFTQVLCYSSRFGLFKLAYNPSFGARCRSMSCSSQRQHRGVMDRCVDGVEVLCWHASINMNVVRSLLDMISEAVSRHYNHVSQGSFILVYASIHFSRQHTARRYLPQVKDLLVYNHSNHLSSNSSTNFKSTLTKLFHKSTSHLHGLV